MSFCCSPSGRVRTRLVSISTATLVLSVIGLSVGLLPLAGAQVDENTYVNPTYGYQLEWDPDDWEVAADGPGDLALSSDLVDIYLQSGQFYAGDATACRDDLLDRLPDDDTVADSRPYDGDGEQTSEADGRAYSTLVVDLNETDDQDARTVVERIDCRTLVAGEAVLAITWLAPIEDAEEAIETADNLLDALVIPSFQGQGADVAGLEGASYTDPDLGFSVTWDDSDWTSFVPVDAIFGLNSTTSLISFTLPDDYDGDAAACVEQTLDDLGSSPGIVDVSPIEIDGQEVAGLDDAGWSYAAIDANYGGTEQFVAVRCAAIPGSMLNLRAIQSGPIHSYEDEAELAAPVFASLTVTDSGDGGSDSGATPAGTDEATPAATPFPDQGTPVPDATPAVDGSEGTPQPAEDDGASGGLTTFEAGDAQWALDYDSSIWEPLDPAIYATVDLALGGGSAVVTFDRVASDGKDPQAILDDLVDAEILSPSGDDANVEELDAPPIPSDSAVGAAYRYVTAGGAVVSLGIDVVPLDDDSVVVVRIYAPMDGLAGDADNLQNLLDGFTSN